MFIKQGVAPACAMSRERLMGGVKVPRGGVMAYLGLTCFDNPTSPGLP
jgi:hypothetical protein